MWRKFRIPCPQCHIFWQGKWHLRGEDCPYCDEKREIPARPFTSTNEMDNLMIDRWNEVVKPSDHVYHLGDVAINKGFLQLCRGLNGHKRLIWGNHDIFHWDQYAEVGFEKCMGSRVLDRILFTHIPVHPLSLGSFKANVHGHTHTTNYPNVEGKGPYVNISVEQTDYRPLSFDEVRERIAKAG